MLLKSLKQKLSEAISEMDMGPYLLTQPNPTANGSNPTQPIFRTVLRKDTVNSLGYNFQYEPQ